MAGGSSSHSTRGIDIDSTKDSRWNVLNMQSDFLGLILVAQGAITREGPLCGPATPEAEWGDAWSGPD